VRRDERHQDLLAAVSIGANLLMLLLAAVFLVAYDDGRAAAICGAIGGVGLLLMGALLWMRARRRGIAAPAGTAEAKRWAIGFLVVMTAFCAVLTVVAVVQGLPRGTVLGPVGTVCFLVALVQTVRRPVSRPGPAPGPS
jgi:hypothetical protein